MKKNQRTHSRRVIGVLPGWQVFWVSLQLFLEPMLRGIHTAAQEFDCDLLIACGLQRQNNTFPTPQTIENDYLPVSVDNTDGLIIITNPPDPNMPQLQKYFGELTTMPHPFVSIGFSQAKIQILPDNFQGVYQGLQHLYAHGHRQIAYIGGFKESPENTDGYERHAAYEQFLHDYGLEYDPRLVVYGEHAIDRGRNAMQELLKRNVLFTSVFASNDKSAIGAAQILREHNVRIPQDVAMIGFDNDLLAGTAEPPLTTIQLPSFDMGYHAVEQLLAELSTPQATSKTIRVVGPLVIRESCGCTHQQHLEHAVITSPTMHEQTLIQRLYSAVVTETHHMQSGQLHNFCRELVAAYHLSQQQQTAHAFQTMLETVLDEVAKIGDDISVWQTAITLLEQNALQLADTPFNLFSTQLLMQARLLVAQRAGYEYSRSVIRHNEMTDYLSRLNAHLHTALTLEDILQVIVDHLAVLRIQTIHLALFEPEDDLSLTWFRLFTLTRTGYYEQPQLAETRFFPPPGMFAQDGFHLALVPLIVESRQIGFVVFEAANLELCGSITWQISAALRGSQLYQQAAQDRQTAEEANRLKSRFLAMVSHELRTPIGLISNLSDVLLREKNNPSTDHYLEKIAANAWHLHSLIGDVLDLASTEVGQLRLAWDTVDVTQVFEAVARAGEQLAQDKGLAWEYVVSANLPPIWGDATRLRQVALNLVANAVKFTDSGQVRFSAEVADAAIKITISDTGIGIPPAEQQLIFDEFQKSERTSIRAYGGMGLGLAICRRLIELHRGTIGVISSGKEGEGSTFYFTLPILEPSAQRLSQPIGDKILLLEDKHVADDALATWLREHHYEVIQHALHSDIATAIHESQPKTIIVNSAVPDEHGWEHLRQIRENQHAQVAPVLFHSHTSKTHLLLELDYVTKPLQTQAFHQALNRQGWTIDSGDKKTILIVDDDPGIREMHARMVQDWSLDYQPLLASNGREALEKLQFVHPDLILLDLMMPEMDGFKLLEHLREMQSTRHIPVIVITAHTLNSEEMARLNRGVATIMSKGMFTPQETLTQIEQALARSRKMGTETQRLVRRAMAFIHTHYTEPLAREDIARHVSVSEDYLTRCFKQETGISPIAYLNRYRVNQAKLLLEDSNMSMSEIAAAVGFTDNMHFSRAFRRESAMTPTEYRAKYR